MSLLLRLISSGYGKYQDFQYNRKTTEEQRKNAEKGTVEFSQDFFDYLRETFPYSLKPMKLEGEQVNAVGTLIEAVESEALYYVNSQNSVLDNMPSHTGFFEARQRLPGLIMDITLKISSEGIRFGYGQPKIGYGGPELKVSYLQQWNPLTNFPDHASIGLSAPGIGLSAGGIHFVFLPKKAETAADLDGHLVNLSLDENNSAAVYHKGEKIKIITSHNRSRGRRLEIQNTYYYVGEFDSGFLERTVHVYGHNCYNDGKHTLIEADGARGFVQQTNAIRF